MCEIVAEGIIEAKALREYIDVFTPLVDEGRVHWNSDGLLTRVVEPANVAMIAPATLSTSYFESYDAPGAVTVGLNFERLNEQLKPADSNDLVHLAVDMETRKLQIQYDNAELSMALIDTDAMRNEPDNVSPDLSNWMVVEGHELKRAADIVDVVTDHLFLRGKPGEKTVEISGQGDTDNAAVTLGEEDIIEASINADTEAVFSLDFIHDILKPVPDDAEVRVEFGDEFPVILKYEGLNGHLSVEAAQAPRILSE